MNTFFAPLGLERRAVWRQGLGGSLRAPSPRPSVKAENPQGLVVYSQRVSKLYMYI
jgi:hypothetical protein